MKISKKGIIAILLAMLMVLSSFGAVFAEGEELLQAAGEDPVLEGTEENEEDVEEVVEQNEEGTEEDEEIVEEETEGTEETEEAAAEEPSDVKMLTATNEEGTEEGEVLNVTVNYVDKDGNELADPVSGEYEVGATITSPTIACYTPDQEEVTVVAEQTEYTVTYSNAAPAKVTGLKLHPSYKSIILTWKKVEGAAYYIVVRSTDNKNFKSIKKVTATTASSMTYKDTSAKGTDSTYNTAIKYYYRVYAFSEALRKSEVSSTVSGTVVRPMYEKVTFKAAATLTSHGGKKATRTFKAGQTILAQGFGGGKYKFWYKGSYFYANYVRVYNCKAKYQKNANGIVGKATSYKGIWAKQNYASNGLTSYEGIKYYDKTTAENFVNKSGKKSSTKYLIWVSTYTQHLYVFKGSKGKWKLVKDWECSTGAAKSPTPTGFDKKIVKKISRYSSINYWNPFQNLNSIHGQRSSYRFGKPQSNGCVRNYDKNAKWVYKYCAVGTGVIIY